MFGCSSTVKSANEFHVDDNVAVGGLCSFVAFERRLLADIRSRAEDPGGWRSAYRKVRDRESFAFALASAAVALEMDGERVARSHIALGRVATRPWRAGLACARRMGSLQESDLSVR